MTIPFSTLTLRELLRCVEDSNDPLAKELAMRINRLTATIPLHSANLKKNLGLEKMWGELDASVQEELTNQLIGEIPNIVRSVINGRSFSDTRKTTEGQIKDLAGEQYGQSITDILDGQ